MQFAARDDFGTGTRNRKFQKPGTGTQDKIIGGTRNPFFRSAAFRNHLCIKVLNAKIIGS